MDSVRAYFRRCAGRYDEISVNNSWNAPSVVFDAVREVRQDIDGVLDLGSGTGWLAGLFEKAYPDALVGGFDLSLAMLKQCRVRGLNGSFCQVDVTGKLPLLDDSIDVTVSAGVTDFIEPIALDFMIAEAIRVTRTGGVIAFTYEPPGNSVQGKNTFSHTDNDVWVAFQGVSSLDIFDFDAYELDGVSVHNHLALAVV